MLREFAILVVRGAMNTVPVCAASVSEGHAQKEASLYIDIGGTKNQEVLAYFQNLCTMDCKRNLIKGRSYRVFMSRTTWEFYQNENLINIH